MILDTMFKVHMDMGFVNLVILVVIMGKVDMKVALGEPGDLGHHDQGGHGYGVGELDDLGHHGYHVQG